MTHRLICALLALFGACTALPARAQNELGPEIVRAATLPPDAGEKIDAAARALDLLTSDDPAVIQRGRNALLAPLRDRRASVAFRTAYGDRLIPTLRELVRAERDLVAINALRIAGEAATSDSAAVLAGATTEKRVSVRYAAVAGIGRTFDALAEANPAINADGANRLIDTLAGIVAAETDPDVLDAAVRAVISARRVDRPNFESVRGRSFTVLSKAAAERLQKLGGDAASLRALPALVRAAKAVRDAMIENNPRLRLGDAEMKAGAELAGHLVGYVIRRVQQGQLPPVVPADDAGAAQDKRTRREHAASAASLSESIVALATATAPARYAEQNLADDLRKTTSEGDNAFLRRSLTLMRALSDLGLNTERMIAGK